MILGLQRYSSERTAASIGVMVPIDTATNLDHSLTLEGVLDLRESDKHCRCPYGPVRWGSASLSVRADGRAVAPLVKASDCIKEEGIYI